MPARGSSAATGALRRRVAPKAEETSDVTRFRGVVVACVVAVAATLVAAVVLGGRGALRGPGPLSLPHREAGLECASCHGEEADSVSTACVGCHGAHPSTRTAHRELRSAGELGCATCHAVHRSMGGVAFDADAAVTRFGPGFERGVDVSIGFHGDERVIVPLVPARACSGCHALDSPRDPVAACLVADQSSLGGDRPTVCFDEHRAVGSVEGRGVRRDAAWEAAARVAAVAPSLPVRSGWNGPLGWVGAGLLAGAVALAVGRRRRTKPRMHDASSALRVPEERRLPVVDTSTCLGCYACVDACPYDVLEVRQYVAVVAKPDDCCGLTLCEQRCPNGSLVTAVGERAEDRPGLTDDLESVDVPGVYVAGDLGGLPLIRNAINQGAHAVRAIARDLQGARGRRDRVAEDAIDLVVVGAGPAGISAALEAKKQRLGYVLLEQGSVAESIRSFPRGKLVFDQPLGMPLVGDLWLEESTKEELLAKWLRIVRREKLAVREGRRVTAVERVGKRSFAVTAVDADGAESMHRARRVLLALGRRGSPRKLPVDVPESMADHVHYHLADARSFAGQRVVVVGLGDVAMEAALALSRQPETRVTVSYRGRGFRRGKARNVDAVRRAVAAGRIELVYESNVTRIEPGCVALSVAGGERSIACDSVFVMIGSIPPKQLVESVGVRWGTTLSDHADQ